MMSEGSSAPSPKRRRVCHSEDEPPRPLEMNLFRLTRLIMDTDEKTIDFCQQQGLLPHYSWCPSCHARLHPYQKVERKGKQMHYRFQCSKTACSKGPKEVSMKKGTWFEGSRISIQKSLLLAYCFANHYSNQQTIKESSLFDCTSSETVGDYFSYCREVCAETLFNGSESKMIGGQNFTVEIDEAKFGKRKFNRGRVVEGQWVLGGICRETRECFLVPVEDRTEATLIALIKQHVRVGTTIHTDCFRSYNRLREEGYVHLTVNHSENFVDPQTGACTNVIESTWWAIRRVLPSNCTRKRSFALHLAEYIWRKKNREGDVFLALLQDISKVYPGPTE